ncbi:hypothetical protein VTL71DRAFT_11196 [Oculimacula yallundae]|uniref:Uncharacterized protein n=1 Tax=Oculimacula yallundae TaxID=86028 RepID=A0ABR4CVI5_9HELO
MTNTTNIMSPSSLDLLRKITPNAILDKEIASTIPSTGTGINFTDRQAMLILRLSLKERNRRASEISDNKGRSKFVRLTWYNDLTEQQLATVGLSLGKKEDTKNGSRRYRNARTLAGQSDIHVDGNIPGEGTDLAAAKNNEQTGGANEIIASTVKGATQTLASILASDIESKTDRGRILKVSIGWIHDMDGPRAKKAVETRGYCGWMLDHDDKDSEDEIDNFTDILLNTKQVSTRSFVAQLDTAMVDAFPDVRWSNLTLHEVEFVGWSDGERFRNTLRETCGDTMTETQIEEASADLNYMQIFVGYEYVSQKATNAVRTALGAGT